MGDGTQDFMNFPGNFLSSHPLLVSVPPDCILQPIEHFKINRSEYVTNAERSMLQNYVCELELDRTRKSKLKAYWCPYEPDKVKSITVGDDASFMFTANMDGCTFAKRSDGSGFIVSHVNAGNIGCLIQKYSKNCEGASVAQKYFQERMALQALGSRGTKVEHSLSGECTTIVGVRDISVGSWCFYKQVIAVQGNGSIASVRELTSF